MKIEGPRSKRSKYPRPSAFRGIDLLPSEVFVVVAVVAVVIVVVTISVSIVVCELAEEPALVKEVDRGKSDVDNADDADVADDVDDADNADEARGTTALHSQIRLSSLFQLSIKQP